MTPAQLKMALMVAGEGVRLRESRGHAREDALREAKAFILEHVTSHPGAAMVLPSMVGAWAECGFPLVQPSHTLAASLMCTRVPAESADATRPPWRCFAIEVPNGLVNAGLLLVLHSHSGTVEVSSFSSESNGPLMHGTEKSLGGWSNLEFLDPTHDDRGGVALGTDEKRSALLVGRLLVGVCMELDGRPVDEDSSGGGSSKRKRGSDQPTIRRYVLRRSVKVNLVQQVRDFVSGRASTSPTVQSLIRGHWKRQAHGPGGTERKWIHVEPYWRGPEDAPIAVRSHLLGTKDVH